MQSTGGAERAASKLERTAEELRKAVEEVKVAAAVMAEKGGRRWGSERRRNSRVGEGVEEVSACSLLWFVCKADSGSR